MYLSEKPRPIDFYKESSSPPDRDMIIETLPPPPHHHHHLILGDSSGGEEPEIKAPKKRAETWVQEETRSLINFRREVDGLFNTSKSNKHLWEQISSKMRDKGFDRSPTMCTDKWRNLLKEFKKARQLAKGGGGGGRSAKMTYYEELEELLRDRTKNNGGYKSPNSLKVDPFIQFSDKSLDDANIPFGSLEANDRSTVNMERRLDSDSDPLAITAADAVGASGVAPWNWRETPGNVAEAHSYCGRIITIKLGDYTRRIGIDGTAEAIKEAIKSAFRIRTKRAFWLEDEDQVVRSLDREMPLGNYTLHLDEGITIKICLYDDNDPVVRTEEVTFYTEDDFRDFLNRRGLSGLREMTNCLREMTNYRRIDTMDDLHSGAMYQGVRLLGD